MPTALAAFAHEVGADGPVTVVGGRTAWRVGGDPDPAAREVRAPRGIVSLQPAEMIARVRAGTSVAELDAALAEHGQMVTLDPPDAAAATVGGVLAVGRSGLRRLRWGPVRDTVLEARYVSADGRLIKAGGPVVKNVSGFDLCRLLVGSLGTLGLLAEVVLRVQPRPAASRWLLGRTDPFLLRRTLLRPTTILWDGTLTWVHLEGHPADVDAEADALGAGFVDVGGAPALPEGRASLRPSALRHLRGDFLAEVGVGTVHGRPDGLVAPPAPDRDDLHEQVRRGFDPTGRLNPGRRPW